MAERIKKADKIFMLVVNAVVNIVGNGTPEIALNELQRLTGKPSKELDNLIGLGTHLKFTRTGKPKWPKP